MNQSVAPLTDFGPGWIQPTLCRLRFTIASSGVATVSATGAPGLSAAETATDGEYAMTFPSCRNAQVHSGTVYPATPGTASNHRHVRFDLPSASGGTLTFRTIAANGGAVSSPNDTSTVDILIWLDLG